MLIDKYLDRADESRACLCKKKDCRYMAKQNLKTCDYILITGKRRGCPVENCDKYLPGKVRRTLPVTNLS